MSGHKHTITSMYSYNSEQSHTLASTYHPKWTKSDSNKSVSNSSYSDSNLIQQYTYESSFDTKSKYYQKEVVRDPIEANEIRIEGGYSIVYKYVDFALDLFNQKHSLITITASGRNVGNAIHCAESIKRKRYGLHQVSSIENRKIKEVWAPLEKYLKEVIIEYEVIFFKISLTFDTTLVNKTSIGYQKPIPFCDLGDSRELYRKFIHMKQLYNNMQVQQQKKDSVPIQTHKQIINQLQNKNDAQKEMMESMRVKHYRDFKSMQNEINNSHSKYDLQQVQLVNLQNENDILEKKSNSSDLKKMQKYNKLEIENDIQKDELFMMEAMRVKHCHDFKSMQNEINNSHSKYDLQQKQLVNLQNENDKLEQELAMVRCMKENQSKDFKKLKNKFSELQTKYDVIVDKTRF